MNFIKSISGIALIAVLISSCTTEEQKPVVSNKPAAKKVMQPFRYHKAIEVKPGLTLDVVSWGRGSNSVGGYMVLRSDSTHLNYRSISGELDGRIVDAWDMDLDSDGNPELYIQSKGEGEGSYLSMYIYEYNESGSNQQIRFPELGSTLKKGYKGSDSVYVKDGKLMRQFPLFSTDDSISKATGQIRKLEYTLRSNSLSVKEVEKEEEN
ncbi:hypothetical protein [Daejeonella lutea]|uniref:Lipoprotein n=1 Tax=Daejeonella lutea TaxID=572036 RepID=A0A1T5ATK4_9SPHI|nr:hypothetical protein [Daejeonella lutea]SKB38344.1 hypothetical protein SAMN05661099_1023 [Daejeonella lutea]